MTEIDGMDILYFLRCRAFALRKKQEKDTKHIEDVWPDS